MDLMEKFKEQAKKSPKVIVYPEGEDERILEAVSVVSKEGIAKPILLGKEDAIKQIAAEKNIDISDIPIINPKESDRIETYAASYSEKKGGIKQSVAARMVKKSLFFGAMMVASNDADGMVAGIANATASVLTASGLAIGYQDGVSTPSSFFIMVVPEALGEKDKTFIFADCAVAIDPTAEQLAGIAIASGINAKALLDLDPKIAMLSFSTKGSASHDSVDKVVQAVKIAKQTAPDMKIDGEFQADAAIVAKVAAKKVKESDVAGQANVLVFPDLNTGNVAYKLTQYLAGAKAVGPVLQGFKKPVNDLSRGASVEDVIGVSAITVIQAQG